MPEQMWRRAQMLVEETQQKIETQREIVAHQEQRGIDAGIAKQLLQVWEAALVRRIEIRDGMRTRADQKAHRSRTFSQATSTPEKIWGSHQNT